MNRRTAVLLLGLGCLLPSALAQAQSHNQALSAELYFPPASGEWESVSPSAVGWSAERLDELLEWTGTKGSSDVVITLGGRILAERHFELSAPPQRYQNMRTGTTNNGRPIEDVASVQKSVLSFLTGVARGEGLLDLDDPVSRHLGTGWSKATPEQETKITLRHLMSMTTGLSTAGEYDVDAGTRWQYNTRIYARIGSVLEKVFDSTLDQLTRERLARPAGMQDTSWQERKWLRAGTDANRVGLSTTARDLARFGILVLAEGRWAGTDLLGDPTYLSESLSPSQKLNPSYGLLWWLNGQEFSLKADGDRRDGSLVPSAPDDLVAGLGALGRKVYVAPSLQLVVTRLGDTPGPEFDRELWRRLLSAAPDAAPEASP